MTTFSADRFTAFCYNPGSWEVLPNRHCQARKMSPTGNGSEYRSKRKSYNLDSVDMSIPIRVLVAKPGLDGHDRGAKVIARALRDAGMEVIYTGLRQTPEMIVNAALQEDVQVIGLSILSGAHNAIVPRVMELLRAKEMNDVLVVVGGIIPDEDAAELKKHGVAEVFSPAHRWRNRSFHSRLGEADRLSLNSGIKEIRMCRNINRHSGEKRKLMQDRLNIAVFVDYDNIEIGVKSTLRREFDVFAAMGALKERGDIVAKFAYANWGRQEGATRQMAENAVQMVQRIPSPRGDKNGADINLALDALEMAFTHAHVNAFAIVSGDSDFIPLVNKLKEYGKTVFVVGGKAFTSTILQQNCHEFISYESLLEDGDRIVATPMPDRRDMRGAGGPGGGGGDRPDRQQDRQDRRDKEKKDRDNNANKGARPAPLELSQAMPLVERALHP